MFSFLEFINKSKLFSSLINKFFILKFQQIRKLHNNNFRNFISSKS